jgi:D-erythronate 2-dehydrogenase
MDAGGPKREGAMVNVVITGGAGFVGSRLARELLAAGSLGVAGGGALPISAVTLVDRVAAPPDLAADERVTPIRGDLGELLEPGRVGRDALVGADVIFHLAAAVSGECEADFDLGMRANLQATGLRLGMFNGTQSSPSTGRRAAKPPAHKAEQSSLTLRNVRCHRTPIDPAATAA